MKSLLEIPIAMALLTVQALIHHTLLSVLTLAPESTLNVTAYLFIVLNFIGITAVIYRLLQIGISLFKPA